MIQPKTKLFRTSIRKKSNLKTMQSFMRSSLYSEKSSELFSSFSYQDQVTRNKYELSELKSNRRFKTQCDDSVSDNLKKNDTKMLQNEFRLLQAIKQNRNKTLAQNYKNRKITKQSETMHCYTSLDKLDELKVKRRLRKEVSSLNHQFLREYLYHQQPFSRVLSQINTQSNSSLMNSNKIIELKNKILKCIQNNKQSCPNLLVAKDIKEIKGKGGKEGKGNKEVKEGKIIGKKKKNQIDSKIQKDFSCILEQFQKEICDKVKMESQFNLYAKVDIKTP